MARPASPITKIIDPSLKRERTPLQKAASFNYIFLHTMDEIKDFKRKLGPLSAETNEAWKEFVRLAYEEYGVRDTNRELTSISTADIRQEIQEYNSWVKQGSAKSFKKVVCRKCLGDGVLDTITFADNDIYNIYCTCETGQQKYMQESPAVKYKEKLKKERELKRNLKEEKHVAALINKEQEIRQRHAPAIERLEIQWEVNLERKAFKCLFCESIFFNHGWAPHTNKCDKLPKELEYHPVQVSKLERAFEAIEKYWKTKE